MHTSIPNEKTIHSFTIPLVPPTAFKITKSHVDALVAFATPEEAEAALASLHLDSDSSGEEEDDGPARVRKTKKKVKKQQMGNFTQFRNKSFNYARHAKKGGPGEEGGEEGEN